MEGNEGHLVVFDVEGVLLPERRFLLFEVAAKLGIPTFLKFFLIGLLYEVGLIPIESALRRLFKLLRGTPIDELFAQYRRLPLTPGATELFKELRENGFKTALISSGLPRIIVEDLANRLGADYASGLDLETKDGDLTGEIRGDVLKPEGKAAALKKILKAKDLHSCNCILVADDRNNLPLLKLCRTTIGYNPDFFLTLKSDHVIRGDLSKISHLITGKTSTQDKNALSRSEILRELIHISGILIPFISTYLHSDYIVALLIMAVALTYTVSEILRMLGRKLPIFSTITLNAADRSEIQEFAVAPIFYAVGIISSLLLFNPPVSYASIAILALGDSSAKIFGKKFGRTVSPLNRGKRVEGSISGLIFAFLGALMFVDPASALIGAILGILAEGTPSPIDDNLTIPLASGLALTLIA